MRLHDGGVVSSVLSLSEALAARGHEVVLLTTDDSDLPENWKVRAGQPAFDRGRGVPASVLLKLRDRVAELFGSSAEEADWDTVFQRLDAPSMRTVEDLLSQADVVHLHGIWTTSNLQIAGAARRQGVPYVVSPHGNLDRESMAINPLLKRLHSIVFSKRMLRRAAAIHCTSHGEIEQSRRRIDNSSTLVIPLALETAVRLQLPGPELAHEKYPRLATGAPLVLFLGRLHPIKNLERLIRSTARWRDTGHNIITALAGPPTSPAYGQSLQDLAASLRLGDACQFLGMVAGQTKLSVLQAADVMVLLSRHENFSVVILEAMCCGTPVVTTKNTSIWPDLQEGGGAIIVDDDRQLDEAIYSIVSSPERRRDLSAKAKAWALQYVDTDSIMSRYEQMYREITQSRRLRADTAAPPQVRQTAPTRVRVLHVTSAMDPKLGSGPAQALARLACEQKRQGLDVTVVTTDIPASSDKYSRALRDLGITVLCTGPGRGPFQRGAISQRTLRTVIESGIDIVHIHGIWQHLPHCAASEARRAGIPYIIRPAGMLEPHALNDGWAKKRAHLLIKSGRDLRSAAAVQATAGMEARNLARLGFGSPVLVVPNGVDLAEYATHRQDADVEAKWPSLKDTRRLLFMGRVDPIKGTMNLAEAWGGLCSTFPQWRLVIAGPDWRGHQAEFEAALARHGARQSTLFVGAVYGSDKRALLASCDVLVQPSFQENFGITIAESLASARPVITTKGTPWHVLESDGLGWWTDIGAAPLQNAMMDAMSRPREVLDEMGMRGRTLMEEQFAWPIVTRRLTRVYEWALARGAKPSDVYLPGSEIPD